jgi:hypothetical protein
MLLSRFLKSDFKELNNEVINARYRGVAAIKQKADIVKF